MSTPAFETTDLLAQAGEVIRDLVFHASLNHPLPWRVDYDWSVSVIASDGVRIITGAVSICEAVIGMAETIHADVAALDAELNGDELQQQP